MQNANVNTLVNSSIKIIPETAFFSKPVPLFSINHFRRNTNNMLFDSISEIAKIDIGELCKPSHVVILAKVS
jgi:hypothetical protein